MFGIGAVEQVAQRPTKMGIHPPTSPMLGRVMDHVASLAKCSQLFEATVAWIMMQMRTRQNYRCPLAHVKNIVGRSANPPTLPVPPIPAFRVPPPSVTHVEDALQMSPTAMLAATFGTDKPNEVGDMPPIDRIQKNMLRTDRHRWQRYAAKRIPVARYRRVRELL